MSLSEQVKIKAFDKYIMRGGDQSLQNIEDYATLDSICVSWDMTQNNLMMS